MPSYWPLFATCGMLAFTGIVAVGLVLSLMRRPVRTTDVRPQAKVEAPRQGILGDVLARQQKGQDVRQIAAALGVPLADVKLAVLANTLTR